MKRQYNLFENECIMTQKNSVPCAVVSDCCERKTASEITENLETVRREKSEYIVDFLWRL